MLCSGDVESDDSLFEILFAMGALTNAYWLMEVGRFVFG